MPSKRDWHFGLFLLNVYKTTDVLEETVMGRFVLMLSAAAAAIVPGVALADWHKGYVVGVYESPGWMNGEKDTNCPEGSQPDPKWAELLKTPWRSEEDVLKMTANGGIGFGTPLSNRGPKPNQNIHRDPTLVPPENAVIWPIVGNTGYGFDLDGDTSTGFVSPDGKEKGLDSNAHRAVGCNLYFRRGGSPYDLGEMRGGAYTIVFQLSGTGDDPRNDPNVRVGIYLSKEQIAKDANGELARDYSYRIDPDKRFMTVYDAVSKDGVVKPKAPLPVLKIREFSTRQNFPQDLVLEKPQIDMTMRQDGTLYTRIGGYRDWRYLYAGYGASTNPGEVSSKVQTPALWYQWMKYADWKPAGQQGPNTHISSFYHMNAWPAFLITPDSNELVKRAEWFEGTSKVAQESAQSLATRMRSGVGGDPSFRLEGGAAAWPNAYDPSKPQPPAETNGWAAMIQNPTGGLPVFYGQAKATSAAQAATPPGPQAAR